MSSEIEELKAAVERLGRKVQALEDLNAVRALHFKYGYYFDACLYEQIVELFAEDAELKFLNGIYRGKAGARRLYCGWLRERWTRGHEGPIFGLLYDHLMLQDVIDIAPDGLTAKGRFRGILMAGFHLSAEKSDPLLPQQLWEGGVYENEYVKDAGVWKFRRFDYNMLWQADYEKGWAGSEVHLKPLTQTFPDDPKGPDELTDIAPVAWPQTRIVPFHYPHPVTGEAFLGDKA